VFGVVDGLAAGCQCGGGWADGWVDRETRRDGCRAEGESEGRGGSVVCVSAALGPSAHPPPFHATSSTAPARPPTPLALNYPRRTLRTGTTVCGCVRGVSLSLSVCARVYASMCGWVDAPARIYVRRACVLRLTNISCIYSGLPYVPDM